jgi:cytosine/adenosine deaminase-related metal-dependent hydrolase
MTLKAELKDLHYAKLYKWYLMASSVIDKEKQRIKNYFLGRMIKHGYTSINLYDMGYVRVTDDRFSLNFKSSPSEVTVSKQIQKLPKNF